MYSSPDSANMGDFKETRVLVGRRVIVSNHRLRSGRMCPRNLPGSVRRYLDPVSGLILEIILPYLARRAQKESLSLSTLFRPNPHWCLWGQQAAVPTGAGARRGQGWCGRVHRPGSEQRAVHVLRAFLLALFTESRFGGACLGACGWFPFLLPKKMVFNGLQAFGWRSGSSIRGGMVQPSEA